MPGAPTITLEQAAMAVEAVESRGWSQTKAAELAGISQSSVSEILAGKYRWGYVANGPVFHELRFAQKKAFQVATFEVCRKALVQVDKTIDKASAYQAAGIYGLLRDHERKDAGEPTEITVTTGITASISLDKLIDKMGNRLIKSTDVTPTRTDNSSTK